MSGKNAAATHGHGAVKAVSDGHPADEVQYREHKVILRPEPLSTRKSFDEFAKLVRHAAKELDIALFHEAASPSFTVREVLFFDTRDYDLYNNSFIFRHRTYFRDGWPDGDTEQTLKYRSADLHEAAEVDVRPSSDEGFVIKFKEEILPSRHDVGSLRSLYSHNSVLHSSEVRLPQTFDELGRLFPATRRLGLSPKTRISLVNELAVEEVAADIGEVHFGHGLQATATLAIWRCRGTQVAIAGEFGFQCKFRRYDDLHEKSKRRSEDFTTFLQKTAHTWIYQGATKTALVYRAGGSAPHNHE